MLVVDLNALRTVYVLHFVHDVFLHSRRALDVEDVGRRDGTVGKRRAGTHIVVLLHENLLRQRHKVLLHLAELRRYAYLLIASLYLAEFHLAVYFAHNSRVGRVARLEQLGYTRQTACDVADVARCAGNLHECLTRSYRFSFVYQQVGTHRQRVGTEYVAVAIHKMRLRHNRAVFRLNHDLLMLAGGLVRFHTVGKAFHYVLEAHLTRLFGNDDVVEGVPLANHVAVLHHVAVLEEDARTVRNVGGREHHLRARLDDAQLGHTAHHDVYALAVLDGTQFVNLKATVITRSYILHHSLV